MLLINMKIWSEGNAKEKCKIPQQVNIKSSTSILY